MAEVIIQSVNKSYVKSDGASFDALKNIDMTIRKGEFVSLLGESGSGKSTLARLILGLEKPDDGEILIDGKSTVHWGYETWRTNRRKIQGVFQDASGTLNPMLSVYRNMEIAMKNLTKLNKKQRYDRLIELMTLTHLDEQLLKTPVHRLSGGEQRRISLLRALSVYPDYIVLDEITGGLDVMNTNAVMALLEVFKNKFGCGCLFITHDHQSAYRISDRVLLMEQGMIINEGQRK